jgi:Holliday junction resolvase RusA-like endonuclease
MPASWSNKKKNDMCDRDHTVKPDLDNLLKALQDCLCKNDQYICKIQNLSKTWSYTGKIIIEL